MCLPPDPLRPLSEENARKMITWPHFRVSIRLTLEESPKRPFSLPEVYHLVRLPPDLPPTPTSKLIGAVQKTTRKQVTFTGFGCHKL